jgi:CheY-like chemotaxis protein
MCKSLLYIEDSALQRELFKAMYHTKYDITSVSSAEEAIEVLKHNTFDVIVTDLHLGNGMDGDEFAHWAKSRFPDTPISVLTANIFYRPTDLRVIYKPTEVTATEFD